jgi:hypothetical protein
VIVPDFVFAGRRVVVPSVAAVVLDSDCDDPLVVTAAPLVVTAAPVGEIPARLAAPVGAAHVAFGSPGCALLHGRDVLEH